MSVIQTFNVLRKYFHLLDNKSVLVISEVSRNFNCTSALEMKKWRSERGLPVNRNAEGILTDGPDYTYLDGRPTPLLVGNLGFSTFFAFLRQFHTLFLVFKKWLKYPNVVITTHAEPEKIMLMFSLKTNITGCIVLWLFHCVCRRENKALRKNVCIVVTFS